MSNFNKKCQNCNCNNANQPPKPTWLTAKPHGGFNIWKTQDMIPEIVGTIAEIEWHFVKFVDGKFVESIPAQKGIPTPDGYKRSVALEVTAPSGKKFKMELTAPQARSYQEYKSLLGKAGKDARNVTTKMKPFQSAFKGTPLTDIEFQEI